MTITVELTEEQARALLKFLREAPRQEKAVEDASEKVRVVVDDAEGHGYQRAKREAAYGWFLRWLMGRGDGRPWRACWRQ